LRKDLEMFANLRPAICYPALASASSLKPEIVEGLDIMIVRELTGGVYFGEPKQIIDLGNGQKRGIDTQVYDTYEIERIGRVAFELARKRYLFCCAPLLMVVLHLRDSKLSPMELHSLRRQSM